MPPGPLGLTDRGRIAPGLRADLAIWDADHPAELAYRIGATPLHPAFSEAVLTPETLVPGQVTLAQLERIFRQQLPARLHDERPPRHRGRRRPYRARRQWHARRSMA
jgi:hypothetical protein